MGKLQLRSIPHVPSHARQGEILQSCGATMFLGDDMIHLMGRRDEVLMQPAILTAFRRSFDDLLPQLTVHADAHDREAFKDRALSIRTTCSN